MKSQRINLRKDLIEKELDRDIQKGYAFSYKKLSNKFLDWIFRHYYIQEVCENYYDSTPDFEIDDENNIYFDIEFCNWQEPYFKGNWGMSQKYVNTFGKNILKRIKKDFPVSIKERLYYAQKDDIILIYFYGRDLWCIDYWFIFKRKDKKK